MLFTTAKTLNAMKPQDSKTFSEWMNHLGAEHHAQEAAEAKSAARRELIGKIVKITFALAGLAAIVSAFVYRVELGQKLHQVSDGKLGSDPTAAASAKEEKNVSFHEESRKKFGSNLNEIRDFAKERDKLLEEFSAGTAASSPAAAPTGK
jgi:hypothetical protein